MGVFEKLVFAMVLVFCLMPVWSQTAWCSREGVISKIQKILWIGMLDMFVESMFSAIPSSFLKYLCPIITSLVTKIQTEL